MTNHLRLVPALTFLGAFSALASPPTRVHAAPSTPAAAAPHGSSSVLEVADRQRPRHRADRRADRRDDGGDAQVEQLNETSLQRARQGQNAPGAGPDTTSNLNDMSERNAERGRNTGGRPPMPLR